MEKGGNVWLCSARNMKDFVAPAFQSDAYSDERFFMLNWFT